MSSLCRRNAFQQTLAGLAFTTSPDSPADIFSRACVESFDSCDWAAFGYPFTQIFEPAVLEEVAWLEGVPYASLRDLEHQPTDASAALADLVADAPGRSVVEIVNVASALVSISRFDLASGLLHHAAERAAGPREHFEIAWLEFLISNRRDDGAGSPAAFARMRLAISDRGVPRGRILDACTQAVVWHVKRRELSQEEVGWWTALGASLVKSPDRLDIGTVSSWYRGVAMVPAAKGDAVRTRRFMHLAREAAEAAVAATPRASDLNTVKTYYESALKEHLYVSRDLDAAEDAGRALVDLDPAWSPSYGELAEVYDKQGRPERAAELCEQAVTVGAPYVGHHLMRAAGYREAAGDDERAVQHYETLAELAPRSERVLSRGLSAARRISHPSAARWEHGIEQLRAAHTG